MPPESKFPFLTGLFLICMCGLMLQIIETKILSVISYYYLAFFAIAMAMFGMTAGSLFVYFRESSFPDKDSLRIWSGSPPLSQYQSSCRRWSRSRRCSPGSREKPSFS